MIYEELGMLSNAESVLKDQLKDLIMEQGFTTTSNEIVEIKNLLISFYRKYGTN